MVTGQNQRRKDAAKDVWKANAQHFAEWLVFLVTSTFAWNASQTTPSVTCSTIARTLNLPCGNIFLVISISVPHRTVSFFTEHSFLYIVYSFVFLQVRVKKKVFPRSLLLSRRNEHGRKDTRTMFVKSFYFCHLCCRLNRSKYFTTIVYLFCNNFSSYQTVVPCLVFALESIYFNHLKSLPCWQNACRKEKSRI